MLNRLTAGLVSPYARAVLRKRLHAAAMDSLVVATGVVLAQIAQSPWFVAAGALHLLPGANVPAGFLETMTLVRDVQGQRSAIGWRTHR